MGESRRSVSARQPNSWCRALSKHLAAKPEEFGRPATGSKMELATPLYQPTPLYETSEILFVQSDSCQCLHNLLELEQSELVG